MERCAVGPRHDDPVGADHRGQAGESVAELRPEARVRSEPRLEVEPLDLELTPISMRLGIQPADQATVVENRQGIVAVHALRGRGVNLEPIVEVE